MATAEVWSGYGTIVRPKGVVVPQHETYMLIAHIGNDKWSWMWILTDDEDDQKMLPEVMEKNIDGYLFLKANWERLE